MARQLYIVAMPDLTAMPGQGDEKEQKDTEKIIERDNWEQVHTNHSDSPFYAAVYYTSIQDLCAKVGALMKPGDSLLTLEISAEGSPRGCGGLTLGSLPDDAQLLMALRWYEGECNFYLAACNTGTTAQGQTESLAKQVATAMKFNTPVVSLNNLPFQHKLHVWGTLGYLVTNVSGTHLDVSSNHVQPIKKDAAADATPYGGAKDAYGQACWSDNPNFS
jgi:hypothetical protein